MAVFVTGGTGFVGVNLIRSLVASRERVRALVRPATRRTIPRGARALWDSERVELIDGDVTDIASVRRGMDGCSVVYHLAGWVQITPWGMDEARRVNVEGTENVCRVCQEQGVQRMLHTSSIAAVGHGTMESPATEETRWNLAGLRVPYYTTKYEGELVVRRYVDSGLDAVIVNPGYVVGPFDVKPTAGRMILKLVTGGLAGYPARGGIGFVDVREVVEGMRAAVERGRRGERYILVGENMSYREYAHLVARVGGVAPPKWAVPYGLLFPAAWLATGAGWIRPAAFRYFNLSVLRTGFCDHYLSSEKARRELGVKHWPIEGAVKDALSWFEQWGYVRRTKGGWCVPREGAGAGVNDRAGAVL